MGWQDILKKIITAREFLQSIQEKTGGEITDKMRGRGKWKIDMILSHDAGFCD